MTTGEKASFCALASFLLAPPEDKTLEVLAQEGLRPWLEAHVEERKEASKTMAALFEEKDDHDRLSDLADAYDRIFGQWNGAAVSLVESTYKPWCEDRECAMVFAGSTGLLMGDSAIHMRELYRRSGMETPESFKSMPDHIVLELEFLSFLYEAGLDDQARCFIIEHLDWVPLLKQEMEKAQPHPFYQSAIELIDRFIKEEGKAGKVVEPHGSTKLH